MRILILIVLFQFSLLTLVAQVQQSIIHSVQWSDTTIDVLELGDQEASPESIKVAYIPELQAQVLSFDSSEISDFIKKINKRAPSLSTWKTYRDETCGVEFHYPQNYFVDTMRLPQDHCYGIALTKNQSKLKRNRSIDEIEEHCELGIYSTNLTFFDELSQLGLEVRKESDFFRRTMAAPVYIKANNFRALYWQSEPGRDSDGAGNSWATEPEPMFLIMVEGQPGTAVTFNCGVDIINLIIASTFKFTE
jgi:hypothetical protein